MNLNDFLTGIDIIKAIKFVIEGSIKLHRLVKKNIDKILSVIYHKNTNKIMKIYLLSNSVFFLSVTMIGVLLTFLRYGIFSSMFFLKMGATLVFTVLIQGYLYYLYNEYSKDRLKYLQA